MPASVSTRAKLYRRALGLCAMPGCDADLQFDTSDGPEFVAVAAHIHGEKKGSARYLTQLSLPERNAIDNLLLMCPTHHSQIDADEDGWPAERLHELKAQQERRAFLILDSGKNWRQKFLTLDYLNVPRLTGMPGGALLQIACRHAGLQPGMTFRDIGWGVGEIEGAARSLFTQWNARLTPLAELDFSTDAAGEGRLVWFETMAYTRNGPMPNRPQRITGDLEKDPHIWFRQAETKVCVRYDPAWVTTSTAHVNLREGKAKFAGFGAVMRYDAGNIIVSAWAFGKPMSPEVAPFYEALRGESVRQIDL